MKLLIKFFIFVFSLFGCVGFISSCGSNKPHFEIVGPDFYYLSEEEPTIISFSENSKFNKNENGEIVIEFVFTTNTCEAEIQNLAGKYYFSAKTLGEATFYAVNEGTQSANTLSISTLYTEDDINRNIQEVFNTPGGAIFGKTYEIGINPKYAGNYSFGENEDIMTINGEGKLEIIGIGQGRVTLTENSKEIYNGRYSVYNSILATKIKEDLIGQNIISSKSDAVTNSMLDNITSMDLNGELINDPESALGIRLLKKLESLDLSDNALTDASFLSELSFLKDLNLSNNLFKNISTIVENENLVKLNLSNNEIEDITQLQFLYEIEELDLSNNKITDITPLSNSYSLVKLNLNGNKLSNYKSSLSGMEYLESLYIGHCGIPFTYINDLSYLHNLLELDISGTNPSLDVFDEELTKLTKLVLSDCKLNSLSDTDSLGNLSSLENLEYLDISGNRLSLENMYDSTTGEALIDPTRLTKLTTLCIGNNEFDEIPDLSGFEKLQTLDLSFSYNLVDVTDILTGKIENIVLDNCNSLSTPNFSNLIASNPVLEKVSTIGAFAYLTKADYEFLMQEVSMGNIEWRFLENKYVNKNSVSNYRKSVYFSMDDFLSDTTIMKDDIRSISYNGNREIILSLTHSGQISDHYSFLVPKNIRTIQLYGSKYYTYDISFSSEDRYESSLTFDLYDYKVSTTKDAAFSNYTGSKTFINSMCGTNSIKGSDGYTTRDFTNGNDNKKVYNSNSAVDCYDLEISVKENSKLTLSGGNGGNGQDGRDVAEPRSYRTGMDGVSGAPAIKCNSVFVLEGYNLSIVGGNGGNGGNGSGSGLHAGGDCSGGHGGNGGNGAHSIIYHEFYIIPDEVELIKGVGGYGGTGGQGWLLSGNGSNGANGTTPNSPIGKQ